jgi:hypothetical protein
MEGQKHEFKYRYVCEKCGKQTDWIKTEFQEETETSGLGEIIATIADKDKFKKQLQAFREKVEGGQYDFHFIGGSSCPFCGTRQSWLPVTAQSIFSPGKRIAAYMSLYVFLGLIVLIIYLVCKANHLLEDFDDNIALAVAFILLPVIGLVLAIRRNSINAKLVKQQVADITVRNKPEIDWKEGE